MLLLGRKHIKPRKLLTGGAYKSRIMMMTSSRWLLTLCLLLGVIAATAQPFKLSGSLREMLDDNNGQAASRLFADNPSRIRLIMKVTEARQMASV